MLQLRNTVLAGTLLALTMSLGCKPKDTGKPDVSFVNRNTQPLTLDIYKNYESYKNGSDVMLRKTLKQNEEATLPGNTFADGGTYYMDWYSDDYLYHNWYSEKDMTGVQYISFKPDDQNVYYIGNNYSENNARRVFLNNTETKTSWIAVDAFLYGATSGYTSFWSSLTNSERYHEVTIHKGFTVDYSYKNANGDIQNTNFNHIVLLSKAAAIEFRDMNGNGIGSMSNDKNPYSNEPNFASNSKDTVMATLPGYNYQFMMIRK